VLCHGYSRVLVDLLCRVKRKGVHFRVLVTEGRPHEAAVQTAKDLVPAGIDTTIILDSAAAYHMDQCVARVILAKIDVLFCEDMQYVHLSPPLLWLYGVVCCLKWPEPRHHPCHGDTAY
jgi:hypothetical protein